MVYSIDLRTRVIAATEKMKVSEVSKMFKVSKRSVYEWIELLRETGSLAAKKGYQKGHSHKITDWEMFTEFAYTNQKCTGPQFVEKWLEFTGVDMSVDAMYKALGKIGFTFKKKHIVTKKLT